MREDVGLPLISFGFLRSACKCPLNPLPFLKSYLAPIFPEYPPVYLNVGFTKIKKIK